MAITCDWCNLSIHRRDVALSLTKIDWMAPWDTWQEGAEYSSADYDYGSYGNWYGLNKGPQLGLFDPKYVAISVAGSGLTGNTGPTGATILTLEEQLGAYERYSSSGETVVAPSGDFCEECFEEIVHQCIESSARAKPPFDRGGWMGFTSKYIFTGDMKQPPLMIAVGAAKLDCIDCEDEFHSLHVVYISGNGGNAGSIMEDLSNDETWDLQPTGERWTTDDLKLGRGPMVDYIRRGTWNSWIFNTIDYQGFSEDINVPWRNHGGFLTKKGWVCSDCDD